MKRMVLIFFCFFLFPLSSSAQPDAKVSLDSLLARLPKMASDTNKALLLSDVAYMYAATNPSEGVKYGSELVALSKQLKFTRGLALGNWAVGLNYQNMADYTKALAYFFKAETDFHELNDEFGAAGIKSNIGNVYFRLGAYQKARAYHFEVLKVMEREQDSLYMEGCLSDIAISYDAENKTDDALKYIFQAIAIGRRLNNSGALLNSLINVGTMLIKKQRFHESIAYSQEALVLAKKIGHLQHESSALTNIGMASLEIVKKMTRTDVLKNEELLNAISALDSSMNLASQIGDKLGVQNATQALAEAYELSGDYKSALASMRISSAMKDSLFASDTKETIKNMEDKREIELRDKQLKISELELSSQKRQQYVYIGGLGLLGVIGIMFFRQSNARKDANDKLMSINKQLDEANRVKARFFGILSHDLRAPIANLTSYLHLQREAPEMMNAADRAKHQLTIENAANNLLSVMEDLLLWSKGQMTSFKPQIKSVQVLQLFDEIKKLVPADANVVFNDPSLLTIDTDENFLKTIMRNLTANALKALNNQPNGKVEWKAWEEDGKQYLSVTDNGPGLTKEQLENLFSESAVTSAKTGLGLHIVRDFAQMLGQKIEVKSEVGKGTSFILSNAA